YLYLLKSICSASAVQNHLVPSVDKICVSIIIEKFIRYCWYYTEADGRFTQERRSSPGVQNARWTERALRLQHARDIIRKHPQSVVVTEGQWANFSCGIKLPGTIRWRIGDFKAHGIYDYNSGETLPELEGV
ncbi:hypothetical protein GBAR_LOCUS24861, partial [Geodia barretti]